MNSSMHIKPVEGPSVWYARDWVRDDSWITGLTAENIKDIEAALQNVKRSARSFPTIKREMFPLPSMERLLAKLKAELLEGRGFFLLKGLPVGKYSVQECEQIFWGIGTHLGTGVTQNAAAEFISHVYDRRLDYTKRTVRAYQVRDALAMHCDNSDLVGLLCVRAAMSGGASLLTSSMAAFNEILRTRPEFLGLLFSGFPYDRKNEQGPGEMPFTQKIPVFSASKGVVSCRYARSYIRHAQETTKVKLSPLEVEALDYLDSVTSSKELQIEMYMEPGDMQFCNNYTVLHARRGFEDHPEAERGRLLLRLWLEVEGVRQIESDIVRHGFHRFGNLGKTAADWLAARPPAQTVGETT
jgi:hypothetical protein